MQKDVKPLISVVMPVKNGEATIADTIESIISQTFDDFEFIIVNDSSTDGTEEIVRKYAASDPRIILCNAQGSGISAARNTGLAASQAPLYACMDADDIAEPDRLERQASIFNARPNLLLLGSFCTTFESGRRKIHIKLPTGNATLQDAIMFAPVFFHPSIMARTKEVQELGGYRSTLDGAEDHDLYLRLACIGEIDILPEYLLNYRLHPSQTTQLKRARSHVASAAAIHCNLLVRRGDVDPICCNSSSIDNLAFSLLQQIKSGKIELTKDRFRLVTRTLIALFSRKFDANLLYSFRIDLLKKLFFQLRLKKAVKLYQKTRHIKKN